MDLSRGEGRLGTQETELNNWMVVEILRICLPPF